MAITLQTQGTAAAGTTSVSPAYPAGVAAGRLAVLRVVSKLGATAISVPGTYTQLVQAQGGTGVDGIDTGQTRVCIFYLVLTGSESGTVAVGSGLNSCQAVIDIYNATNGFNTASFGGTSGADTTHGTAWSATMGATLGFTTGDMLVGVNACTASTSTQASKAVSATGATFGTLANDRAVHSANGNDINFGTFDFPVNSGTATGAATHTMTTSVNNSGITGIGRLVEAAAPPQFDQAGFIGRNDDGTLVTATQKAAENVDWSQLANEVFRIRFVVDETAGVAQGTQQFYQLRYNRNGLGWNNVDAASAVARTTNSAHVTNAVATARLLTSGTGTFHAGEFDSNNGIATGNTFAAGELTEVEYSLQLIGADVTAGDLIDFRVERTVGGALEAYTQVPTVTVTAGAATSLTPYRSPYRRILAG